MQTLSQHPDSAWALGTPILILVLLGACVGKAPNSRRPLLTLMLSLAGIIAIAACVVGLYLAVHGAAMLLLSGGGCLICSLAIWLSRGEDTAGGGHNFDDPDPEPDPEPDPSWSIDWEQLRREISRQRRPAGKL